MNVKLSIRLTEGEKKRVQDRADELGFKNSSDCARMLIERGLRETEMNEINANLLTNTTQSLMLLREITSMLGNSQDTVDELISNAKSESIEWLKSIKKRLSANQIDQKN